MATKTIAHALFSWTENGVARLAMHGETVEIADAVIAEYEHFGVFEPDHVEREPEPEPVTTAPDSTPAPTPTVSKRPKNVAPEHVWQDHARQRGIDPDGMTKDEIIAYFTDKENESNG